MLLLLSFWCLCAAGDGGGGAFLPVTNGSSRRQHLSGLTSNAAMHPIQLVPTRDASPGVISTIAAAMSRQLHHAQYQLVNAFASFFVGAALLFWGELTFRWLLVSMICAFAFMSGTYEITIAWGLEPGDSLRYVVGALVGMLAAYVARRSVEGVMALFGVVAGSVIASYIHRLLMNDGRLSQADHLSTVALYMLTILFFLMAVELRARSTWLPLVSPLIGGALVSSSILFGGTELAARGYLSSWDVSEVITAPWVDFLSLLCDVHSRDVGPFAGSQYKFFKFLGKECLLDQALGLSLWCVLFISGVIVQCNTCGRSRYPRKDGDGHCPRDRL